MQWAHAQYRVAWLTYHSRLEGSGFRVLSFDAEVCALRVVVAEPTVPVSMGRVESKITTGAHSHMPFACH